MTERATRILLVEDQPGDARLMREYLNETGGRHELRCEETLRGAVRLCESWGPDVILLDLGLPDSSGFDTFVGLQRAVPSVPIVVLTGLDDEAIATKSVHAGAEDYLVKGRLTPHLLGHAVRYAIERHRLRAALQESEALHRRLLAAAPCLICALDPNGTTRYVNGYIRELTGYRPEELIGEDWWEILYPAERRAEVDALYKAFEQGDVVGREMTLRTRSGEDRVVSWNSFNRWTKDGRLLEIRGAGVDITGRTRAEATLRRTNRALRVLSECNQRLVRAASERELIDGMSDAVVRFGEYACCCIALRSADLWTREACVRSNGAGVRRVDAEDSCCGFGPAALAEAAAESSVTILDRNPACEECDAAESRACNGRSVGVFSLSGESGPIGVLAIGAGDRAAFSPEFIPLLRELADDIAYGIESLRRRAAHVEATEQIRFQAQLLDRVGQAVIATDADGRVVYWNPGAETTFGWTADEVIGRPIVEITPSEDLEPRAHEIMAELRRGRSWSGEFRLRRKDGTTFPGIVTDSPIYVPDGEIAGVIGVTTDITALKESERRYRALFEETLTPILVADQRGRYIDANEAALRFLECSREELIGRGVFDFAPPGQQEAQVREHAPFDAARTLETEYWIGGRVKTLLLNVVPVETAGRTVLFGIGQDITEIKEADRRLQRSLQGTIEAVGAITELRDPYTSGHQQRVAALACAIAAEMGLSETQIEGIRAAGLVHDIGKMAVPAEILSKPSALSEMEFEMIKVHPSIAYDVLRRIEFPWPLADIVVQHHERLDGSGYPAGLGGEDLRIEARILAVADVVEAMSSHRPYRPARGLEATLAAIRRDAGTRLDEQAVAACAGVLERGFQWPETA